MEVSVSVKQMQAIDSFIINEMGIPSLVLMERVSLSIAEKIMKSHDKGRVFLICGIGNNGGDGIAVGRLLHLAGLPVTICLANDFSKASGQAKIQLAIAQNLSVPVETSVPEYLPTDTTIVVDALFGIGLNRPVDTHYEKIIEKINRFKGTVVAIDIPSGLSANSGKPFNTAVKAETTYTVAYIKKAFKSEEAKSYIGHVRVIDSGYPPYRYVKSIIESEGNNE